MRLFKKTTLGISEVTPEEVLKSISRTFKARPVKQISNYDLRHVICSIDSSFPIDCQNKLSEGSLEIISVFSGSAGENCQCDAMTHNIEVYPGVKPVELSNHRMTSH